MNVVVEIGRLTADVELKQTQNGISVCSFTVAVYRTKEITDFLPCVAWRETAEFITRYFKKGQMIAIQGSLQSRKYTDKEGKPRRAIEIDVNKADFCEGAKSSVAAGNITGAAEFEEIPSDESLPF